MLKLSQKDIDYLLPPSNVDKVQHSGIAYYEKRPHFQLITLKMGLDTMQGGRYTMELNWMTSKSNRLAAYGVS